MSNIITGMLAKSLAGHDENQIYLIQGIEKNEVLLVDGRIRTLEKPKRKNKKHIQVIHKVYNIEEMQNEVIRKLIKEYKKEHCN